MKYSKGNKPLLQDILNANKYPTWVGHVELFVPIAQSVGYNLFLWNNAVVEIGEFGTYAFTGWSGEEVGFKANYLST